MQACFTGVILDAALKPDELSEFWALWPLRYRYVLRNFWLQDYDSDV